MASPAHSAMSDRPWVNTLISRGCSCRHAIVLKGHEKINLQCKCHIIETEHEANSGKPRKHIRSRKDGRYAGMANSGIPSCCLALLDQVSSKTPGPPAMWNFRPCSRTLHTHGAPTGATSLKTTTAAKMRQWCKCMRAQRGSQRCLSSGLMKVPHVAMPMNLN